MTFLAARNVTIDITLLEKTTRISVPGLSTTNGEDNLCTISGIPPGDYLAWASLKNDGCVMDPDWIYKNPGGLEISITTDSAAVELDFSVTNAIELVSPTNPREPLVPPAVDSATPTFTWESYPQAKEFIVEVKDAGGTVIWGGYEADGTINHPQLLAESTTSAVYDFLPVSNQPARRREDVSVESLCR